MILDLLTLESLGNDRFANAIEFDYGQTAYGGQLVAQALRAAYLTVPDEMRCHSLHLYFLRGGWPSKTTEIQVRRLRDGRSFSHREVDLEQEGKLIARCMLSFHRPEDGPSHQHRPKQPPVPPESLPVEKDLVLASDIDLSQGVTNWFELPIEARPAEPMDFSKPEKMAATNPMWFRYQLDTSEYEPALRDCLLAFLTDYGLLDASLRAHGVNWWQDRHILAASLDHSIWFHHDYDLEDWIYFDHVAPTSGGGRCFNRGEILDRQGRLIGTICQEGLLRDLSQA